MTPGELLRAVEAHYRSLHVYRDRGSVTTKRAGHAPPAGPEATFTTSFRRAAELEYAYRRDDPSGFKARCEVAWSTGRLEASCLTQFDLHGQTVTTDHLHGADSRRSVGRALVDCAVQTDGSSVHVPRLLLGDEVPGRPLTDLDEVGEMDHAGHGRGLPDCLVVSGTQGAALISLWVHVETRTIRRIVTSRRSEGDVTRIDYALA